MTNQARSFYSIIALLVMLNLFHAKAVAYDFDTYVGFQNTKTDVDEVTSYVAGAEAFLESVDAEQGVYAEQDFLARASSISAWFIHYEIDRDNANENNLDGGGVSATFMDEGSDLWLESGYFHSKEKRTVIGIEVDEHFNNYWLKAGWFIKPQVTIYSLIDYYEWKALASKTEEVHFGFGVKGLLQQVNIEAELLRVEYDEANEANINHTVTLTLDYYFNRALSLGGSLGLERGDSATNEYNDYALNVMNFIDKRSYFGLEYSIRDMQFVDDEDIKSISLIAGMRW